MKKLGLQLAAFLIPLTYALPALAEEHGGGKKSLPQLDVTSYPNVLFWMITSFVLFFLIMKFVGVPGVQETIAKRRNILESDLGAARKASEEAKAVVKAYEDGLHDARRKAQETVGGIVLAAAHEASEQRDRQDVEMKHRLVVAQENMATAKHAAMKDTQQYVNDLVDDIVTKIMQTGIETQASGARK